MTAYLSYTFNDNDEFINTFDEAPLWSAAFGLMLLKHLELRPGLTVLDLGSGAGFPLMELAGRLGSSSKLYGIDPWANANKRAKQKIDNYGLGNVEIIEASADRLPFDDKSVDLIVSNLGINNFDNPAIVFKECYRVLRPGGRLALTTNVNGHWKTFYTIFEDTLMGLNKIKQRDALMAQQEHRGTAGSIEALFTTNGLFVTQQFEESLTMNFVNGSAFLNHHFVKPGWLPSWLNLFEVHEREDVFSLLEQNLNTYAKQAGGLNLSVPMLYMEGLRK